jgi:hypothetical protein
VLFNLVVDTLSTLMTRAVEMGLNKGVMSHLVPESISHIQYADDTILMVEGDANSIAHTIFDGSKKSIENRSILFSTVFNFLWPQQENRRKLWAIAVETTSRRKASKFSPVTQNR